MNISTALLLLTISHCVAINGMQITDDGDSTQDTRNILVIGQEIKQTQDTSKKIIAVLRFPFQQRQEKNFTVESRKNGTYRRL